jgi:hypothetical protein
MMMTKRSDASDIPPLNPRFSTAPPGNLTQTDGKFANLMAAFDGLHPINMAYPHEPRSAYGDPGQSFAYGTSPLGGWGGGSYGGGLSMGPAALAGGGAISVGAYPKAKADLKKPAVLGAGAWTFSPGSGIVLSQLIDDALSRMGPMVS